MSFKTAETTLGSAVANGGTFTIAYPSDSNDRVIRDAGYYRNSYGHKIALETNENYEATQDFTLSYGTANITVTWANARTLAVGTKLWLQLNDRGDDGARQDGGIHEILKGSKRFAVLHDVEFNLGAPDTADANGYVESQDLTAAGVFSVDTTVAAALLAAALDGVADVPRNVVAAWTTAAVLTVTGKDEYGNTMVESSSSGTTFTGKKAFKEVTNIETSVNITGLTVGTGDVLGLPVFVPAIANVMSEYQDGVKLADSADKIWLPVFINQTDLLAGTAQQIVSPVAGYVTDLRVIVQTAVTTGGAITVEANTVAVVGLSATVSDADAAGVVRSDSVLKIATGLVAAGDDITVTPAAAFATAGSVLALVGIQPIRTLNGTFVAGDQTEPTATTGDVRGTYDPAEVCNGSLEFRFLAKLPDPKYIGLDQFAG